MNSKTRKGLAAAAGLGLGVLGFSHPGYALGPGGFGANIPQVSIKTTDLGPMSGTWTFAGGVTGFASAMTNPTPALFNNEGAFGGGGWGHYSMGLAAVQIHKGGGWLHFTYWGGAWQTPATGITSDFGAFNSVARFGSPSNPMPGGPTFKWWVTVQPSKYFSISAGELASLEGTEIGFNWMNPTVLVTNLNNMQATPAYGPQLNFFYGPLTVNVQWSDSYKTDRFNMLSYLVTYNLNADGSDNVIAFGHTNLGHTYNPEPGNGFAEVNSSLIGFGAQWVWGPWTFSPEAEYQWLPKNAVNGSGPKPMTTYFNAAAMFDLTYAFNKNWSLTVQPQVVYQNADKNDPNQSIFGNWLQFGAAPGPGTFSPGTTLTSFQIGPTWMSNDGHFFCRPDLDLVWLSGFQKGTGYGAHGDSPFQALGLIEIGALL